VESVLAVEGKALTYLLLMALSSPRPAVGVVLVSPATVAEVDRTPEAPSAMDGLALTARFSAVADRVPRHPHPVPLVPDPEHLGVVRLPRQRQWPPVGKGTATAVVVAVAATTAVAAAG